MTTVITVVLALAGIAAALRVVRRGTVVDRVLGIDAFLYAVICLIAVHAAATGETAALDVPLVVALLGFLGTIVAANWLEHRSRP